MGVNEDKVRYYYHLDSIGGVDIHCVYKETTTKNGKWDFYVQQFPTKERAEYYANMLNAQLLVSIQP